jgi:hypothetical protein
MAQRRRKKRSLEQLARSIAATRRRLADEVAELARRSKPSRDGVLWTEDTRWQRELIEEHRGELLPRNALGIGLGPKLTRTPAPETGATAARVYVPAKLTEAQLERRGIRSVPTHLRSGRRRLPVDVVEVGKLRLQSLTPGTSLGPDASSLATLGAFAVDNLSGEVAAITAMHATGLEEFPVGNRPAPVFYSPSRKVAPGAPLLGRLLRGTRTEVDAALLSVERQDMDWGEDIWGFRMLLPSDQGQAQVHLLGAKNQTSGLVDTVWADFPRHPLTGAFTATYGSSDGDSGAAVIDDYGYVVGFHLGRVSMAGRSMALCSPAALVLDVLQCNIPNRS